MIKRFLFFHGLMSTALLLLSAFVFAQNKSIDVTHYEFEIHVFDHTDEIKGTAQIHLTAVDSISSITLDLEGYHGDSINPKGMTVSQATWNTTPITWEQSGRQIHAHQSLASGQNGILTLVYSGVPSDGLIIDKNKYGHRTFFSDHWPNRGSCYLPLNDHPMDKATSSFKIHAPSTYKVVSNGQLISAATLPKDASQTESNQQNWSANDQHPKLWEWHMPHQIPTKVMVFGVADFDTASYAAVGNVSLRGWVYPEDAELGHREYAAASEILDFFEKHIAPYPFDKLDQVQSKTIFGGMENAGCIFYHENSTGGDGSSEDLIAHEIAHQWFGNTASETDWKHLWISEGFATFFTGFYLEKKYGDEAFYTYMDAAQERLTQFANRYPEAVVVPDSTPNLMALLNPYSYQKGGWVLQMLRTELGEDLFLEFIRAYFHKFAFANASTTDLITLLESYSKKDLNPLMKHYLYHPAIPHIVWTHIDSGTVIAHLEGTDASLQLSRVQYEYHTEQDSEDDQVGDISISTNPTVVLLPKNADIGSLKWNTDRAYLLGPAEYYKP